MAYGICYTRSGSVKKYEQGLLSISPDRIKFVDIDNHSAEPFIPWIFTPDDHLGLVWKKVLQGMKLGFVILI